MHGEGGELCLKIAETIRKKRDKRRLIVLVFRAGIRRLQSLIEVGILQRAVRVAEDKTQPKAEFLLKIRNPGQKLR